MVKAIPDVREDKKRDAAGRTAATAAACRTHARAHSLVVVEPEGLTALASHMAKGHFCPQSGTPELRGTTLTPSCISE